MILLLFALFLASYSEGKLNFFSLSFQAAKMSAEISLENEKSDRNTVQNSFFSWDN